MLRVTVLERRLRREGAPAAGGEMVSAVGKTLSACLLMVIAIIEAKFVFNRIQFNSRTLESIIFCVSLSFMGTAVYFLSSLLLKNTGILMFRKRSANGRGKTPVSLLSPFRFLETVAANPDFYKSEYRYKINIYLASPAWEMRNIGIKLIGLFKDKGKGPTWSTCWQSGRGNGFMRRNALLALKAVNPWSAEIKELLLRLLRTTTSRCASPPWTTWARTSAKRNTPSCDPIVQRRLRARQQRGKNRLPAADRPQGRPGRPAAAAAPLPGQQFPGA